MTKKQQRVIESLTQRLRQRYAQDRTGHDWLHLDRVRRMARRLSRGCNVNRFVIELAALVHDVDDYKFSDGEKTGYAQTRALLSESGVSTEYIEWILDIVRNVSYKGAQVETPQKTMEGKIVQDADRLDAIGAIGIARCFFYGGSKGIPMYDLHTKPKLHRTFEEYKTDSSSINHFYEKLLLIKDRLLTEQAKKVAIKRHVCCEKFLREFWLEVGDKI